MHGSDSTRVCQGDGVTRKVIGRELVPSCTCDDVFVGLEEVGKRHLLGLLNAGDEQCAGSV